MLGLEIITGPSPKFDDNGMILSPTCAKDRARITEILSASPYNAGYATHENKKAPAALMTIIERLSSEQQTKILSTPRVACTLAWEGQQDRLVALIAARTSEQQCAILSAEEALHGFVNGNTFKRTKAERSPQIMTIIENLPRDMQVKILSRPRAVNNIGWKESRRIVRLLEIYTPAEQVSVLKSENAASRLMEKGHARKLLRMIQKMPQENQVQVLSVSYVMSSLAYKTSAAKVQKIVEKLTPAQQLKVVKTERAAQGLSGNGNAGNFLGFLEKSEPRHQAELVYAIKSSKFGTCAFERNEHEPRWQKLMESADKLIGFEKATEACKGDRHQAGLVLFMRAAEKMTGQRLGYDRRTGEVVVPVNMFDLQLDMSRGFSILPQHESQDFRELAKRICTDYNIPEDCRPNVVGERTHTYCHVPRAL